jgi:uncharacterized protein YjeT (DUF2065 family)
MWHDVVVALSLVMVIEGILPFVSPGSWRRMAYRVAQQDDRSMRMMGLACMLIGSGMLYLVNG